MPMVRTGFSPPALAGMASVAAHPTSCAGPADHGALHTELVAASAFRWLSNQFSRETASASCSVEVMRHNCVQHVRQTHSTDLTLAFGSFSSVRAPPAPPVRQFVFKAKGL